MMEPGGVAHVLVVRLRIGEVMEASSMVVVLVFAVEKREILSISTVEERRTTE